VEPDVPVTIFTDAQSAEQWGTSNLPLKISIQTLASPSFNWFDKIEDFANTPYKQTVYLDVDVIAVRPFFDELLQVLHFAPVVIRSYGIGFNFSWERQNYSPAFPQYNTGVVAYDSDRASSMLEKWGDYREFAQRAAGGNQPTFRAALLDAGLYPAELPSQYNFMSADSAVEPVRLVHFVTNKRVLLDPTRREKYLGFIRSLDVPCRVLDGHVLVNKKKTIPLAALLNLCKIKFKTRIKKLFFRKSKVVLSREDIQTITAQNS
jgi:hypothetical protein